MNRVLFISCTNVGKAMIKRLCTNDILSSSIVGIVNLNEKQGINKANYQSYLDLSNKYSIPHHYCNNINDEATISWIKSMMPDLIIQSGWSQKFGKELLSIPRFGCIGEHPSPLPKGRGAACVNWAIINGEKEWGDSFFKMEDKYDEGVICAQEFFRIEMYDTVKTVYDKVAFVATKMIDTWIDKWSSGILTSVKQDNSKATYFKRRRPADGLFNFNNPAVTIHNFIRAQTHPYPCAFFEKDGKQVKVISSEIYRDSFVDNEPGEIIKKSGDGGIIIACKNGETIKIIRVQPENNVEMWAEDWIVLE